MCSRPFETRSRPRFLAATLATLPSMSLFPKAPFDLSVLPIYVARVPAAPFTRCYLPARCRACIIREVAAVSASGYRALIPKLDTRTLFAAARRWNELKLARCPRSLAATLAALPSMSRVPRAPFRSYADTRSSVRSELKLVRCPRSLAATLAALPSISEIPFLD
jgi:hypothetical protein